VGVLFGVAVCGWLTTWSGCFTFGGSRTGTVLRLTLACSKSSWRARLVAGLSGQQYLFGKEKKEKKKSAILMS
jgi:hypothetical protein